MAIAGRGGRDDVPTVGVANEHDRAGQRPQELGEIIRVAREVAKRIGERDDGGILRAGSANLGVVARCIGPRPVDEDDRRSGSSSGWMVMPASSRVVLARREQSPPKGLPVPQARGRDDWQPLHRACHSARHQPCAEGFRSVANPP